MVNAELARMPLFEGLGAAALAEIFREMQTRRFKARSFICRKGEPGNSLLVIQRGLAEVFVDPPEGAASVPQLRPGDIIGEISLLTGEPRSANVRASVTTEVLELSQEAFAAITARHPAILVNLSRILSRRLARPNVPQAPPRRRGEAVALVIGQRGTPLAAEVIEATRAASPGRVAAVDLTGSLPNQSLRLEEATIEGLLSALDRLLSAHARVIVAVGTHQERLALLLEHVDRIVILGSEVEARPPTAIVGPRHRSAEIVLLTEAGEVARGPGDGQRAPHRIGGLRVIRAFDPDPAGPREARGREIAWLGRHFSRTKLGLALGAGGAKGYAHVGALHVLQEAGHTVDYVAGSSIGALVGAWLALGMDAGEIEATMRRTFTPENVEVMFRGTMSGMSAGGDVMARLWRETTNNRSFAELAIPLVAMAVDLETSLPATIADGPLWEALLAATAIPGLFPPYERGEQRLVDGVALVPVPTGAVIEAGADITVSVNLMNREKLAAWPGGSPPEARPTQRNIRTLDALLDVMELTWVDSSVRHAALADVVITPRFGPASWRSFQMADRFVAAGREAAAQQLEALSALTTPPAPDYPQSHGASSSRIVVSSSRRHSEALPQEFTLEDVKGILIDLIGLPAHAVPDDPNASFEELGLDSIGFLEVQIEMEQRYGLRISEADAQQIRTLSDAVEYVNRRLHESG